MLETVKFEFEVLCEDYVNAGQVSSEIKKYLNQIGVNHQLTRKVAICSYEAEINLVIHSLGGKLILEINEKNIQLTSIDKGPGIADIAKAMTPGYSTASEKARELGFGAGMGLPNMKKNADEFYIESNPKGTKICLVYHLSK